jgi:hypothetical protein
MKKPSKKSSRHAEKDARIAEFEKVGRAGAIFFLSSLPLCPSSLASTLLRPGYAPTTLLELTLLP